VSKLREKIIKQIVHEAMNKSINEDVRSGEGYKGFISTIDYFKNKRNCELTVDHIPDWFMAIIFGDQLLSPSRKAELHTEKGLSSAINPAEIERKVKSSDAGFRYNQLTAEAAQTLRDALAFAINIAFPLGGEIFCDQIRSMVTFASGLPEVWGLITGKSQAVPGAVGAAAGAATVDALSPHKNVDITNFLDSCFIKVSQKEYESRLNMGRADQKLHELFMFFPNTMREYSTGDMSKITEDILKLDLKGLEKKIKDVKRIAINNDVFDAFFDEAFYNIITKESATAAAICSYEIDQINNSLASLNQADIGKIGQSLIQSFIIRTEDNIFDLKKILNLLPNGQQLMQLILNYRLK